MKPASSLEAVSTTHTCTQHGAHRPTLQDLTETAPPAHRRGATTAGTYTGPHTLNRLSLPSPQLCELKQEPRGSASADTAASTRHTAVHTTRDG